jgi:hypothetical protein
MSSLFNQTNIAPGTPFASGGGGGGSNYNTISVSSIQFVSGGAATILENYSALGLAPGGIVSGSGPGPQPITASQFVFANTIASGQFKTNILSPSGLSFQGQATGVDRNFLNYNGNGGSSDETFSLNNMSSMKAFGVADTLNIGPLISTLKSAFPGCIS